MRFENLRKSYRFYIGIICILGAVLAVLDIIGKSMWVHMYVNYNHTPQFSAVRFAFTVIVMFATDNTFEAAMCFLLPLAAAELYVDVKRYEFRHKLKLRYIGSAVAVGMALLLEGSQYFHYDFGPAYTSTYTNCSYAFKLTPKPWAAYGNSTNPNKYRTVYKRYILEVLTVFYPFVVFLAIQSFSVATLVKIRDLRDHS